MDAAQAAGDTGALLHVACERVAAAASLGRAVAYRLLPGGTEVVPAGACGADAELLPHVHAPLSAAMAAARRSRAPIVRGGEVVVPLVAGDDCAGFVVGEAAAEPAADALETLAAVGAVLGALLAQAEEVEQLRRLGELKSQFIALASHELRGPVGVIQGLSSTLYRRGDDLAGAQAAALHRALHAQSEHLSQLVHQLLDLSRLDADAIEIKRERFAVRKRVEEIVGIVAPERDDHIEIDVPDELETVADPAALDRIVSNLVVNALRYGRPPVRIAAQQVDRHFRLVVEDRGAGVDREFVPHLFERFSRSAKDVDGTGLGLAIAQSYAQAHGGELLYEPAEPHGARFELVLPRATA